MQTVTVSYQVYKFRELSEEVQEKVINNLRDINVDWEDWHECTLQAYKDKLSEIGFEDADIHYSGFCSQGDGACFDARVNLEKIIKHLGDNRFNKLIKLWSNGYVSLSIETTGFANHYSHERTRYVDLSYYFDYTKHSKLMTLCELLQTYVEELRLSLSREIYTSLDSEYDYLTSKEAIVDTIESNEYDFLESGKIFS